MLCNELHCQKFFRLLFFPMNSGIHRSWKTRVRRWLSSGSGPSSGSRWLCPLSQSVRAKSINSFLGFVNSEDKVFFETLNAGGGCMASSLEWTTVPDNTREFRFSVRRVHIERCILRSSIWTLKSQVLFSSIMSPPAAALGSRPAEPNTQNPKS